MEFDIKDIKLAAEGRKEIEWAERDMRVLGLIRERFGKEKPLEGVKIAACLHITKETANLARALAAGGAEVRLSASNPLSTQDETAASLVENFKIAVFAKRGVDSESYYQHINSAIGEGPQIVIDDGADLISTLHEKHQQLCPHIWGGMEETTTGLLRLRNMERDGALKFPIIAVNDALSKYLFDNRYGTGQSTLEGILRATGVLFAGKTVVVAGYGWCGRGFAMRAEGMGAKVIVTEVNPIRALEAAMDGYWVMPMTQAAALGDIFCTLTGDIQVIGKEHFEVMKDGAILANSGHFDVEVDLVGLKELAREVKKGVRENVDEYILKNGRRLFVLGEGRLVNLVAAEGHPASVMDMSFATQALTAEYVVKNRARLSPRVYPVPQKIEENVARLKLESMGIGIDSLSASQAEYLASWKSGT
ncbi:MAG: S-adenosyl-L-homocysteine hydrolase [Planctomycetes bacterium DG_23]|nr:MAG: S-adenosyl-L-homocysteine hydrolase [Planctomycetes bacterium DG_23]